MSLTSARLTVLGFWIFLLIVVPSCHQFKNQHKQSYGQTQYECWSMGVPLLIQCTLTYVWAWVLDHGQWEDGFWHNVYLFMFGHGFWEFVLGVVVFWPVIFVVLALSSVFPKMAKCFMEGFMEGVKEGEKSE